MSPAQQKFCTGINLNMFWLYPKNSYDKIGVKIQQFSYNKMNSKMSYAKWWPLLLDLNHKQYRWYTSFWLNTPPPPPPPPPVPHICVSESGQHWVRLCLFAYSAQAISKTNTGFLLIIPLGTNINEILIKFQNFSFTKMHLKISSAKWRSFCPGGDELDLHNSYSVILNEPHGTNGKRFRSDGLQHVSHYWKHYLNLTLPNMIRENLRRQAIL